MLLPSVFQPYQHKCGSWILQEVDAEMESGRQKVYWEIRPMKEKRRMPDRARGLQYRFFNVFASWVGSSGVKVAHYCYRTPAVGKKGQALTPQSWSLAVQWLNWSGTEGVNSWSTYSLKSTFLKEEQPLHFCHKGVYNKNPYWSWGN